jgi:hypothetical protein
MSSAGPAGGGSPPSSVAQARTPRQASRGTKAKDRFRVIVLSQVVGFRFSTSGGGGSFGYPASLEIV